MSTSDSNERNQLTYQELLDYIETEDWPVTSARVAREFGITQQAAYYRLDRLLSRDELERMKFNQTVLWRVRDN
jgi:predicted HTH transcriptional regulator